MVSASGNGLRNERVEKVEKDETGKRVAARGHPWQGVCDNRVTEDDIAITGGTP
jgi:hypothetical protein